MVTAAGAGERGPAARREQVRRRVIADGFARVEDLVREFGVSLMTMHRDLDALAAEGWLTKIRGGATANPSALVEAGVRERMAVMQAEKSAITAQASSMLTHGQTIFLDDSTTAYGLIPYLRQHPPMTVATNFLPAARALADGDPVDVVLLGGEYTPRQESCHGLQTVEAIARLHADITFMSTTALSDGLCLHRSEATVQVRQAFLAHSTRSVLLVDHAKFGRPAPHVLCAVEKFDTVITDSTIDLQDLRELRERCADVQVAALT